MRTIDKPGVQPIRALLDDPTITEIMINGHHQVYVERHGQMVEVPKVVEVEKIVEKIVVVPRVIEKIVEVIQIVEKVVDRIVEVERIR